MGRGPCAVSAQPVPEHHVPSALLRKAASHHTVLAPSHNPALLAATYFPCHLLFSAAAATWCTLPLSRPGRRRLGTPFFHAHPFGWRGDCLPPVVGPGRGRGWPALAGAGHRCAGWDTHGVKAHSPGSMQEPTLMAAVTRVFWPVGWDCAKAMSRTPCVACRGPAGRPRGCR